MATHTSAAVIPNSRTPYSVVIRVHNDGDDDDPTFLYTRTNLLAALREGPLKELLRRTPDWTYLNFAANGALPQADYVRITSLAGAINDSLQPPLTSLILRFVADALECSITYNGGEGLDPCDMLVELRMVHSNER
jgi:hypothetical protein